MANSCCWLLATRLQQEASTQQQIASSHVFIHLIRPNLLQGFHL